MLRCLVRLVSLVSRLTKHCLALVLDGWNHIEEEFIDFYTHIRIPPNRLTMIASTELLKYIRQSL